MAVREVDIMLGRWSICRDKDSLLSVHFPQEGNSTDADNIRVLEDGRLNFVSVENFQREAVVNCSVYDEDGHLCAVNNFTFTVLLRSKSN